MKTKKRLHNIPFQTNKHLSSRSLVCVREGHGILPGEQTGHTGSTSRQVHPHLPHPGPQEICLLPLQDVHE